MRLIVRIAALGIVAVVLACSLLMLLDLAQDSSLDLNWVPSWLPFASQLGGAEPSVERFMAPPPGTSGKYISRTYQWEYKDNEGLFGRTHPFTLTLNIPENLYLYYKNLDRPPTADYSIYVTHPDDDDFLQAVAGQFASMAQEKGFDSQETLAFVSSFVQDSQSIAYALEGPEGEYPKYPLETLMDQDGDCEDTSILLSAVLELLDYETILVNLPPVEGQEAGHMGIAVAGDFGGIYYPMNGTHYYYLETTDRWEIGAMDSDYEDREATLYEIVPKPILVLDQEYSYYSRDFPQAFVQVGVRNWGTAAATNLYVRVSFDGENWYTQDKSHFDELQPGEMISSIKTSTNDFQQETTVTVQIIESGVVAYNKELPVNND